MFKRIRIAAIGILVALGVAALPGSAQAASGTVNINTASSAQLQLLPRIGPAVAKRILKYRKDNGSFKSADDLMLVRGIGESTYKQLAPYVSTKGETTLKSKVRARRKTASSD